MSKSKTPAADPKVPLPDPDAVQRGVNTALEKMRERTGLFIAGAILLLGLIAVGAVLINRDDDSRGALFPEMWERAQAVSRKLIAKESAAEEIAAFEADIESWRGTPQEGFALWLLGVYCYREAWTPDKATFEERRPYLEKALAYLGELQPRAEGATRFDQLILARPKWFTDEPTAPTKELYARVQADLEFARKNAYEEPQPDTSLEAVVRTSAGDLHLHFYRELASGLVDNFVTLARAGTYNGTAFHFTRFSKAAGETDRPLAVMAGDPFSFFYPNPKKKEHLLRWGSGGVGYEVARQESRFKVHHRRGIVSSVMASGADWNNGAQFMIFLAADNELDGIHSPFGRVVDGKGIDVAAEAAARTTASEHEPFADDPSFSGQGARGLIVDPVIIHKVIVFENGKALEHAFPLSDSERSLSTVGDAAVTPLTDEALLAGRKLVRPSETPAPRAGLDIPFPLGVDGKTADPRGARDGADDKPKDAGTPTDEDEGESEGADESEGGADDDGGGAAEEGEDTGDEDAPEEPENAGDAPEDGR